jgi:DNA-binding CsgD family transcriptional regulator
MQEHSDSEALPDYYLTQREEQVAALLAAGFTAKDTAARLKISSETVRSHTRIIFLKLRVRNRVELAGKMFRMQQKRLK